MTGKLMHTALEERIYTPTINYLNSEVAIMLCFQLCLAHYTALQTNNTTRSTSAINPVIYKRRGRTTAN